MFIIQQIPLLLMKMDYSAYAMAPDPVNMVVILCIYLFRKKGRDDCAAGDCSRFL